MQSGCKTREHKKVNNTKKKRIQEAPILQQGRILHNYAITGRLFTSIRMVDDVYNALGRLNLIEGVSHRFIIWVD